MVCETCNGELNIGDYPFCRGDASKHQSTSFIAVSDDIPGGVEVRHGICNEDGSPRRYYSKSEMAKEAKRRGMVNYVVHVPQPGSDKSKHTQRFV